MCYTLKYTRIQVLAVTWLKELSFLHDASGYLAFFSVNLIPMSKR